MPQTAIVVTNNPLICGEMPNLKRARLRVCSEEGGVAGVLETVRDLVHLGHRLLTHPLSGSVKPNETPYKTVLLTGDAGDVDIESLDIIERSMAMLRSLGERRPLGGEALEAVKRDYSLVDYSLIIERLKPYIS